MQLKIKATKLEDLDALQSIEKECFIEEAFTREHLAYLLDAPNSISLTAKTDHQIVGFIIGVIETFGKARVGHIYTIDVAVKHRRTGIGLRLLEELEHAFQKRDAETVYLEVRADNRAALELYRKRGYSELQPLENYYSKGAYGLRMKKVLRK